MISPRNRGGEVARFYTVTEPKRHPRGYTVYKVTARVSCLWGGQESERERERERGGGPLASPMIFSGGGGRTPIVVANSPLPLPTIPEACSGFDLR